MSAEALLRKLVDGVGKTHERGCVCEPDECSYCTAISEARTLLSQEPPPATPTVRAGRAFEALLAAKRDRGVDFCIHTSWCSDFPHTIVLVRPAPWSMLIGEPALARSAPLGRPVVDEDPIRALERAAEMAST